MDTDRLLWGLFARRRCVLPTWRGWLLLLILVITLGFVAVKGVYPFLAPVDPIPGGVLVVEGWGPDYQLEAALAEFRRNHYDRVFVTGGPLEWGAPLADYHSYAERGAAVLLKLGLSTNEVQAVPAPFVRQDRTYTSALSLKKWWRDHGMSPTKVHLITEGPHARRSRLIYEKALGDGVAVGITPVEDRDYDPAHWWRSSAGVRGVTDEAIAYLYARFLFHPRAESTVTPTNAP